MSAEILRRAAALMRERAEAVSHTAPSPWIVLETEICTDDQEPIEALSVMTSGIHWRDAAAQRVHVASWHPVVALAVAGWLDAEASNRDAGIGGRGWFSVGGQSDALTVARAYLGESA